MGLPAEHHVVGRDASDVGQTVPGEDGVRQHGVELREDALPLELLFRGVKSVSSERSDEEL